MKHPFNDFDVIDRENPADTDYIVKILICERVNSRVFYCVTGTKVKVMAIRMWKVK